MSLTDDFLNKKLRAGSFYFVEMIRFCFYAPSPCYREEGNKKSVYYWFENNPGVHMTEELDCFSTLEKAEEYCALKNEVLK